MKRKLLKFGLPIGMGLMLSVITIFGLISTTFVGCEPIKKCDPGSLLGSDGKCYGPCESGSTITYTPVGNCSAASAGGVYCCSGGGGGGGGGSTAYCTPGNTYNFSSSTCCPNATPYYYNGYHGIYAIGCYKTCPYANDCGNRFQKY